MEIPVLRALCTPGCVSVQLKTVSLRSMLTVRSVWASGPLDMSRWTGADLSLYLFLGPLGSHLGDCNAHPHAPCMAARSEIQSVFHGASQSIYIYTPGLGC